MKKMTKLALVAGALVLHGCASGGVDTTFTKRGTSMVAQKSDSDQCWKQAQKTNITAEQASGNVVAGFVIGGLVGGLVASSAQSRGRERSEKLLPAPIPRRMHGQARLQEGRVAPPREVATSVNVASAFVSRETSAGTTTKRSHQAKARIAYLAASALMLPALMIGHQRSISALW